MDETALSASVRDRYRTVHADPARLWESCTPDVSFHIAGAHPLSGSYLGPAAVRAYLDAVRAVPGDRSGFTITSVLEDSRRQLVLVEGTARNGEPAYERPVVHLLRFRDALLAEFWDYPFDQRAEDAFWREHAGTATPPPRIPVQRGPSEPRTPPLHEF